MVRRRVFFGLCLSKTLILLSLRVYFRFPPVPILTVRGVSVCFFANDGGEGVSEVDVFFLALKGKLNQEVYLV